MPLPIKPIEDKSESRGTTMDYSFLFNTETTSKPKKTVYASNEDASLLYHLWTGGEKVDEDVYHVDLDSFKKRDLDRLKFKGFLEFGANEGEIEFTKKGRIVITTMALGERNRFEKKRQEKSYHEILASMSKKGKNGFRIPKYANSQSNVINISAQRKVIEPQVKNWMKIETQFHPDRFDSCDQLANQAAEVFDLFFGDKYEIPEWVYKLAEGFVKKSE